MEKYSAETDLRRLPPQDLAVSDGQVQPGLGASLTGSVLKRSNEQATGTAQAWHIAGTSLLPTLGNYCAPLCPEYFVSSHLMPLMMCHLAHFTEGFEKHGHLSSIHS